MPLSPQDARVEFPILRTHTYLNSCSLGALSHRAEMYLDEFLGLWHTMGASAWYEPNTWESSFPEDGLPSTSATIQTS